MGTPTAPNEYQVRHPTLPPKSVLTLWTKMLGLWSLGSNKKTTLEEAALEEMASKEAGSEELAL